MISLLRTIAPILTFLGLLINLVGVMDVCRFSDKIRGYISFIPQEEWHRGKKRLDRALRFIVTGTALQVFGALINLLI
jgi:hypothetical protein